MKRFLSLITVTLLGAISLVAADIIVTDADMQAAGTDVTWTSDNVYILDGFVFVGNGQTLNIEAGTIIKGKPGQEENASALIIAKGGKIMANGTADNPIIFTAEADDLAGSVADMAMYPGLSSFANLFFLSSTTAFISLRNPMVSWARFIFSYPSTTGMVDTMHFTLGSVAPTQRHVSTPKSFIDLHERLHEFPG